MPDRSDPVGELERRNDRLRRDLERTKRERARLEHERDRLERERDRLRRKNDRLKHELDLARRARQTPGRPLLEGPADGGAAGADAGPGMGATVTDRHRRASMR